MNTRQLTMTTNAAGAYSADIKTPGKIYAVSLVLGDLSTPDLSCTDLLTGEVILAKTGIAATTRFQPQVVNNLNSDGSALASPNYDEPVCLGTMHVAIAGGGDKKTGTLYVTYGG